MLRRIKIDSITFNSLLKRYPKYIIEEDLKPYFSNGYKDKHIIRVNTDLNIMIVQGIAINGRYGKEIVPDWMQIVCYCDDSLNQNEIKPVIYAYQADNEVFKVLKVFYQESEIDALFARYELNDYPKYLHELLPESYKDGKIHRFHGCRYYDINKAHTAALCDIFPKAKEELIKLTKRNKDYINFFVGNLCNNGHRKTYNWICQRTYDHILKYIKSSGGLILYGNTDGFITYCPTKELETSPLIGDIKQQSVDGIIYAYYCNKDKDTTPYTIYQYNDIKTGKELKGNARLAIRTDIDLSIGQIVKAKIIKEQGKTEEVINKRIIKEQIEDEEESYDIF